jgi:vesicle coat complex subunit
MHELRMELHSTDRAVKVDAVKKVIASMTVGKDVSMLFTDVLNCVQTGNIELKKLVYLYLINVSTSRQHAALYITGVVYLSLLTRFLSYNACLVLQNTTRIDASRGQYIR